MRTEDFAERHRARVAQTGSCDGLYRMKLLGLRARHIDTGIEHAAQPGPSIDDRDPRCGMTNIRRRLRRVDVQLRMDRFIDSARATERFVGKVGDYFVDIEVDRDTSASSENINWELIEMLASD